MTGSLFGLKIMRKVALMRCLKRKDSILHTSIPCRYGRKGSWLWVRETWRWLDCYLGAGYYVFKADFKERNEGWERDTKEGIERIEWWKPSIHMPKEAARIWLQVESVRVERLQDISDADALAEGIEWKIKFPDEYPELKYYRDYEFKDRFAAGIGFKPRHSFFTLWRSINGRESFVSNPWVWVISYKVLSTTGKPDLQTT
jgi:hypothetical protein